MELGRDEQKPTLPVINLINPTDLDRVVRGMYDLIREYHGWDWVNVPMQYRIGGGPLYFGVAGEPIRKFLQRLIFEMKVLKTPLTQKTSSTYRPLMINKYGYSEDDIRDYFKAYLDLVSAGEVPESIQYPWGYRPTSIVEDAGKQLTSRLGLYILLGVAVYGLSTSIIPQFADAARQ